MKNQQEKDLLDAFRVLDASERTFVLDLIMDCAKECRKKPALQLVTSRYDAVSRGSFGRKLR